MWDYHVHLRRILMRVAGCRFRIDHAVAHKHEAVWIRAAETFLPCSFMHSSSSNRYEISERSTHSVCETRAKGIKGCCSLAHELALILRRSIPHSRHRHCASVRCLVEVKIDKDGGFPEKLKKTRNGTVWPPASTTCWYLPCQVLWRVELFESLFLRRLQP